MVQVHLHQKATMKIKSKEKIYKETGMNVELKDTGCCSIGGYTGFEKGN